MGEIDKELKLHEVAKSKADSLQNYAENLVSALKRIFKDIVTHYESLKARLSAERHDTYNNYKEGLDILNINSNELEDYISNNRRIDLYQNIISLLENSNYFDVSQVVETFINLKEKIIGFYRNGSMNTITENNQNTFNNSTIDRGCSNPRENPRSKYEGFLNRVRDTSKNKEVLNEMDSLMKNLKHLNDNN